MTDPALLDALRAAILVAISAVLLYSVLRYRHAVLHRIGVGLLVAAAVTFAVSLLVDAGGGQLVVIEAVQLVAAGLYLAGLWRFAAAFVRFDSPDEEASALPDLTLSAEGGGFDDGD